MAPLTNQFTKGEYCVDYDVNYQEGDQFKSIPRVQSVDECRLLCLRENNCKYYVWRGDKKRKPCLLKSSGLWLPKLETGKLSTLLQKLSKGEVKAQNSRNYLPINFAGNQFWQNLNLKNYNF